MLGDRGKFPPFGVAGGGPAAVGHVTFCRGGREEIPPQLTKADGVELRPGDTVRVQSPGGGGYGDPREREPWSFPATSSASTSPPRTRGGTTALWCGGTAAWTATARLRANVRRPGRSA